MKSTLRSLRISPRKTRLVADLIRGKSVDEAVFTLMVTRRAASERARGGRAARRDAGRSAANSGTARCHCRAPRAARGRLRRAAWGGGAAGAERGGGTAAAARRPAR